MRGAAAFNTSFAETILYYFNRRFRSQVTEEAELNLFNFGYRSLASRIAVLGGFPAIKPPANSEKSPKKAIELIKS